MSAGKMPTSARKARLIADMIRGLDVNSAMELLQFDSKRASSMYLRVLKSATANAAQDENVNLNKLYVSDCRADDGPLLQGRLRWRPGPQRNPQALLAPPGLAAPSCRPLFALV